MIFNRGQNSAAEQTNLPVGYAALIENANITDLGKIKARTGLTRVGDAPAELVMAYNFNNSTVTENVGALPTTSSGISFVAGQFGKAAKFNGTGSYINGAKAINVTTIGPCRFSFYIKGTAGTVVDKWATHAGVSITITGGEITFKVGHGTTDALVVTTNAALSATVFKRVDCVYNADLSLDVYVNGSLRTYGTDTTGDGALGNDTAVDLVIGEDSSITLDDFRIYDGAYAASAGGMNKITGLAHYDVGTTIDKIYRTRGTYLEALDTDFKDWTIITGTNIDATLDVEMLQAKDLMFIFQSGKNCHTMSTAEAITDEGDTNTDPPQGTTAEYMPNNRLFVSGVATVASRDFVYFSDALDPQTFNRSTNVFKVRSGGGGAVKKIKRWRQNELVIYKEDSIYVLADTNGANPLTDWNLFCFHPTIGCKAPRSVVSLGDEHIFLANDGVRYLSRTQFDEVRNGVISDNISDIIARINRDQLSKACAAYYDNKYILAVPLDSATENNYVLIWDSIAAKNVENPSDGWTVIPLNTWRPSCFASFEFSDNKDALLFGYNQAHSLVYRAFNGTTDDGATIVTTIIGPEHNVGYVRDAIWNPLFVVCESDSTTDMRIDARVNRGTFEQMDRIDINGSGGVDLPVNLPFDFVPEFHKTTKFINTKRLGRGKTFQAKFIHDKYNMNGFIFNEYTMYASPKGAPRGS
jgi:hypothetical protein